MIRDFKGVWIAKEIYLDKNLNWTEKILLIEIESLDGEEGCYASNEYFANHLMISKDRVSRLIAKLINLGYVTSKLVYKDNSKQVEKRILKAMIGYSRKQLGGIGENNYPPIGENNKENNTLSYNNNINIYSQVIEFLNKTCGTSFKHSSKKTQSLINARVREGFKLEDFETVINKKADTWLNDEKMNKYLRPETLFGTKFEGYLNEKIGGVNCGGKSIEDNHTFKGIKLNIQ